MSVKYMVNLSLKYFFKSTIALPPIYSTTWTDHVRAKMEEKYTMPNHKEIFEEAG
jgi:hypothetical protein